MPSKLIFLLTCGIHSRRPEDLKADARDSPVDRSSVVPMGLDPQQIHNIETKSARKTVAPDSPIVTEQMGAAAEPAASVNCAPVTSAGGLTPSKHTAKIPVQSQNTISQVLASHTSSSHAMSSFGKHPSPQCQGSTYGGGPMHKGVPGSVPGSMFGAGMGSLAGAGPSTAFGSQLIGGGENNSCNGGDTATAVSNYGDSGVPDSGGENCGTANMSCGGMDTGGDIDAGGGLDTGSGMDLGSGWDAGGGLDMGGGMDAGGGTDSGSGGCA